MPFASQNAAPDETEPLNPVLEKEVSYTNARGGGTEEKKTIAA